MSLIRQKDGSYLPEGLNVPKVKKLMEEEKKRNLFQKGTPDAPGDSYTISPGKCSACGKYDHMAAASEYGHKICRKCMKRPDDVGEKEPKKTESCPQCGSEPEKKLAEGVEVVKGKVCGDCGLVYLPEGMKKEVVKRLSK
jgi:hypothetical protein